MLQLVKEDSIFAVKIIRSDDEEIILQVQKTFKLQKTLNSIQSMCKTYELFIDESNNYLYQVMEYVEWPSLKSILKEKSNYVKKKPKKQLNSLCQAVHEMHSRGICHRDLKPDNIMVNPQNYSEIKNYRFWYFKEIYLSRKQIQQQKIEMWTMTGTLQYKAPEMFQFGYSELVDTWAVGVIAYEMLTGLLPFYSDFQMDLIEQIQACNLKYKICNSPVTKFRWSDSNGLVKDFIKRLICHNDESHCRLSSHAALNHLWMENEKFLILSVQDDISIQNENNDLLITPGKEHQCHNKPYKSWQMNARNMASFSIQTPTLISSSSSKRKLKLSKISPIKMQETGSRNNGISEDSEEEEEVQTRVRAKTKTMLTEFVANNSSNDVHRSQPLSPCYKSGGGITLSQLTLDQKIRDRKNSVKQMRTPKTSESEINTPQSLQRVSQFREASKFKKEFDEIDIGNEEITDEKPVSSSGNEEDNNLVLGSQSCKAHAHKKSGFGDFQSPKIYGNAYDYDEYHKDMANINKGKCSKIKEIENSSKWSEENCFQGNLDIKDQNENHGKIEEVINEHKDDEEDNLNYGSDSEISGDSSSSYEYEYQSDQKSTNNIQEGNDGIVQEESNKQNQENEQIHKETQNLISQKQSSDLQIESLSKIQQQYLLFSDSPLKQSQETNVSESFNIVNHNNSSTLNGIPTFQSPLIENSVKDQNEFDQKNPLELG